MKHVMNFKNLPFAALGLGGAGFILRKALYAMALDQKNLLLRGQPLEAALWVVTAAALLLAVACAAKLRKDQPHSSCGRKRIDALGCGLLAVGILVTVVPEGFSLSGLVLTRNILGVLAAAAMAIAAVMRCKGQPVFFLLHCVVCIFFAIHMVSCYQGWSSNPQIQDYVFTLLSSVGLMLFAYQQAACAAGCGSQPLMFGFGLMTVFSCFAALSGTEYPILYLTGGIWTLTNLCGE